MGWQGMSSQTPTSTDPPPCCRRDPWTKEDGEGAAFPYSLGNRGVEGDKNATSCTLRGYTPAGQQLGGWHCKTTSPSLSCTAGLVPQAQADTCGISATQPGPGHNSPLSQPRCRSNHISSLGQEPSPCCLPRGSTVIPASLLPRLQESSLTRAGPCLPSSASCQGFSLILCSAPG